MVAACRHLEHAAQPHKLPATAASADQYPVTAMCSWWLWLSSSEMVGQKTVLPIAACHVQGSNKGARVKSMLAIS